MDLYAAISDPIRRKILGALCLGPCTVSDLASATRYHQPGVSRHLRVLREVGLVNVQPDGTRRVYTLRIEPFLELEAWTHHHIKSFGGRLDRLGDLLHDKREK